MKLMGHRGSRDKAAENTLKSFVFFKESGLKAVEFDIHETVDGVWVVHHDDTLDRTTIESGPIKGRTWEELSKVRTKEGEPLPRLEEVLDLFDDSDIELQIELKSSGDWKRLGSLLSSYKKNTQFTVISFNHRWLLDFKMTAPDIRTTCLVFALPVNPVAIVQAAKADGLSLSVGWIDKLTVQECHQAGFKVTAWSANDRATFRRMKELGIDYLGTDMPYIAKDWDKA